MEPFQIDFVYQHSEEKDLEDFLSELQDEIGGERKPYSSRRGAIDLLTVLSIVVTCVIFPTLQSAVQKYLDGLLGFDGLKDLGEAHRKQIVIFFQTIENKIHELIRAVQKKQLSITTSFTFEQKEEAFAIEIPTKFGNIYVVLNHKHISPTLLEKLPRSVVVAIRYLHENPPLEEAICFQLYYDVLSQNWIYLFAPTTQSFGYYIDRYIDLQTQQIKLVSSRSEFIELFQPASEDELKFIISPFR
jgi:hypothetical protein